MTGNSQAGIEASAGESIWIKDVRLHFWDGLAAPPASSDRDIYLHKDRAFVSRLDGVLEPIRPRRMIEIGVLHGGSTIYWEDKYQLDCLIAFDLAPDAPHLVSYLRRHQLTDKVHTCFGVSQTDAVSLRTAVRNHARGQLVDAVIDDASHQYAETRATLEILLPFVRPGGVYIIEDWAWGHGPNWPAQLWADQPLMSALLVELILICGHGPEVIEKVEIDRNFVVLRRGTAPLAQDGGFKLTDYYISRGFSVSL